MAFASINGIVLHHQVIGPSDGPALVFINSLGSDFRIWQEVVPAFADRERWVGMMKASIARLAPHFSMHRAVIEYAERYYLPAHCAPLG